MDAISIAAASISGAQLSNSNAVALRSVVKRIWNEGLSLLELASLCESVATDLELLADYLADWQIESHQVRALFSTIQKVIRGHESTAKELESWVTGFTARDRFVYQASAILMNDSKTVSLLSAMETHRANIQIVLETLDQLNYLRELAKPADGPPMDKRTLSNTLDQVNSVIDSIWQRLPREQYLDESAEDHISELRIRRLGFSENVDSNFSVNISSLELAQEIFREAISPATSSQRQQIDPSGVTSKYKNALEVYNDATDSDTWALYKARPTQCFCQAISRGQRCTVSLDTGKDSIERAIRNLEECDPTTDISQCRKLAGALIRLSYCTITWSPHWTGHSSKRVSVETAVERLVRTSFLLRQRSPVVPGVIFEADENERKTMTRDPVVRLKLLSMLNDFCMEASGISVTGTITQNTSLENHRRVCIGMITRERETIVESLLSHYRGDKDVEMTFYSAQVSTRAGNRKAELLPVRCVTDLVCTKSFKRLRVRLHRLFQQDMMQLIHDNVQEHISAAVTGLFTVRFHFNRWDISDYCNDELKGSTDIGCVLTLTGGASKAYASRCVDYVKWLWKNPTYNVHSCVRHFIEQGYYDHPDSGLSIYPHPRAKESVIVRVTGSKQTIVEIAQQLVWLTAALRSVQYTALSEVDFISTDKNEFYIEPADLTELRRNAATPEICWHRLVGKAAIARGFPIPARSDEAGLELSLHIMLSLSGVSSFLVANGRMAFYGFSSMLFPTGRYRATSDVFDHKPKQSIQWHFEVNDDRSCYFDSAEYFAETTCTWANNVARDHLAHSRHFVGFCRVAEFRLGTLNSNYVLQESALPESTTALRARIENVTIGTSGLGFGTLETEAKVIYPSRIINPVVPDEYLGTLDTIGRMSMILWDCKDQCGWLVPAQALLLHMAHMWVQMNGMAVSFRHACEGSTYLKEVDEILRTDRKMVIRPEGRDDDTDFELRHLIMRFWKDIRGCMLAQQSALRDNVGAIGYQSKNLSGWELFDFLIRPPLEFSMIQEKRKLSDRSWVGLAADKNIPVLFCRGAGEVVHAGILSTLCDSCRLPKKQASQLVASLMSLQYMAQKTGGFREFTKLTPKWGWQPTEEQVLFKENCRSQGSETCHRRIQKLQQITNAPAGNTLALPITGAVVFGEAIAQTTKEPKPKTAIKGKVKDWLEQRFK